MTHWHGNQVPFEIVFSDSDDLTDWDYNSKDDTDMDDPEVEGWKVQPLGGIAFLVTSPDGDEFNIDGSVE